MAKSMSVNAGKVRMTRNFPYRLSLTSSRFPNPLSRLAVSGPRSHGMGHPAVKHGNRGAGGDGSRQHTCAHGGGCRGQMIAGLRPS